MIYGVILLCIEIVCILIILMILLQEFATMNKSWMLKDRRSNEYEEGVNEFLKFSRDNGIDRNMMCCPCNQCGNLKKQSDVIVKEHLFVKGINTSYTKWVWHGEISDEIQ